MVRLQARHESWPIAGSFTISRGSKTSAEVVVVELRAGKHAGWGECVPYTRYGETVDTVLETLRGLKDEVADGMTRADLQDRLPPGAARNALDCAFWDLEAKRAGKRAWSLAGLRSAPKPIVTAYTISLGTAESMAKAAAANAARPLFKLKLTGKGDVDRVAAVRKAAPQSRLIVDANEAWTPDMVAPYLEEMAKLGVAMVEQPLPAGNDAILSEIHRAIPVCADESAHACSEFGDLVGKYDMINIKLDKTGGLTEAMKLKALAEAEGMRVMVGCMLATSLAMAPAVLLAQNVDVVDLDGPLLLTGDRDPGLTFDGSIIRPPKPDLWG